jgi:hypothetical protein
LAIVKNGGNVFREKPEVKYVFMAKFLGLSRVTAIVRVLKVSASGSYSWRRRQETGPSPQAITTGNQDIFDATVL